jgi:predicted polyphosphate/ATP-dependent NAD kinase
MSQILAYKPVDLVQQRFLRVTSIGGNCLIAGERSMSVSSRVLPTVEGDSVIHVSLKKTVLSMYVQVQYSRPILQNTISAVFFYASQL